MKIMFTFEFYDLWLWVGVLIRLKFFYETQYQHAAAESLMAIFSVCWIITVFRHTDILKFTLLYAYSLLVIIPLL